MKGNDHRCSLDVNEFAEMVKAIRSMELSLGSEIKKFQKCEEGVFQKLGKHIVASTDLKKGDVISKECISIKVIMFM